MTIVIIIVIVINIIFQGKCKQIYQSLAKAVKPDPESG